MSKETHEEARLHSADTEGQESTAQAEQPPQEPYEPATPKKRMLAWAGVVFMVLLVLVYTYSVATGKILLW